MDATGNFSALVAGGGFTQVGVLNVSRQKSNCGDARL